MIYAILHKHTAEFQRLSNSGIKTTENIKICQDWIARQSCVCDYVIVEWKVVK